MFICSYDFTLTTQIYKDNFMDLCMCVQQNLGNYKIDWYTIFGALPLLPLAKIQSLCFWQKVGVFLSISCCIFAIFFFHCQDYTFFRCYKHNFIVIFTPMKFNEAVRFKVFMTKNTPIHNFQINFILILITKHSTSSTIKSNRPKRHFKPNDRF